MATVTSVPILATVAPATGTAPTVTTAEYPQRTFATLNEAITDSGFLPADTGSNYRMVDQAASSINAEFDAMAASGQQVLVLTGRTAPYEVDMSLGFRHPSALAVDGWTNFNRGGRGWFCVTRGLQAIMALDAGVKLNMKNPGGWSAPQQPADGTWGYTDETGTHQMFNSASLSVIQFDHPNAGAFNLNVGPSVDMGGVAYSFFKTLKNNGSATSTEKRVTMHGSWEGFLPWPNGETGGFEANTATYRFEDCWHDGNRPDGTVSGTSPFMVNNATGGQFTRVASLNARDGMATIWNSSGTHTITDSTFVGAKGQVLNLEKLAGGTVVNINGGRLGTNTAQSIHVGVGDVLGSIKLTLRGVTLDALSGAQGLSVQTYAYGGAHYQNASDITAFDAAGAAVPVTVHVGT